MFPRTAQQQWWFLEPEQKNRSQAIGLRLAIAYHERDAESVARLLPADDDEIRLVMGALENGLLGLNQLYPPGPPDEVWERVTPIIDASAPRGMAPRIRALLAAMSHAMSTPRWARSTSARNRTRTRALICSRPSRRCALTSARAASSACGRRRTSWIPANGDR
jgi:hypothetical protein